MMLLPRMQPSKIDKLFLLNPKKSSKEEINEFENKFKEYINCKDAIAVSSARTGFYLVLKALDIKKGDEVILAAYNFSIIPNILLCMGINPVFVDIDENTHTIDTRLIQKNITKKTKAIISTHIEGNPCNMDEIMGISKKNNLKVIEDCAHALGAEYKNKKIGSFGYAAVFSFGVGKQINTLGGGMITLRNSKYSKRIRETLADFKEKNKSKILKSLIKYKTLRVVSSNIVFSVITWPFLCLSSFLNFDLSKFFFEDKKTFVTLPKSMFYKYSEIQANLGLYQLENLEQEIEARNKKADLLEKELSKNIVRQKSFSQSKSAFLHYTIITKKRKELIKKLLFRGIDTQATWMKSCSKLPFFEKYKKYCPVSDKIEKEALYLPFYPSLKEKEINYITETLNSIFKDI